MLRKRSRSSQKDQQMADEITFGDSGSETCLQSDVPGLFVGLSPINASDCDSVKSPTSPLDFKVFSNGSYSFRFPKPSQEGHLKSWDCNKVGLGSIVDSLSGNNDGPNVPEKIKTIPSFNSKTILFGSQIKSKGPDSVGPNFCESPKSLPKNYPIFPNAKLLMPSNLQNGSSDVLFEIGEDPLDSDLFRKVQSFPLDLKRLGPGIHRLDAHNDLITKGSCLRRVTFLGGSGSDWLLGRPSSENELTTGRMLMASGNDLPQSLTHKKVELSEDYTCVISHGPNTITTRIFGDCVLGCHPNGADTENKGQNTGIIMPYLENCCEVSAPSTYPTDDFLSSCYNCNKKLEQGKDIFMYRDEKAFCSLNCRLEMISNEEEHEESITEDTKSENGYNDIF